MILSNDVRKEPGNENRNKNRTGHSYADGGFAIQTNCISVERDFRQQIAMNTILTQTAQY